MCGWVKVMKVDEIIGGAGTLLLHGVVMDGGESDIIKLNRILELNLLQR